MFLLGNIARIQIISGIGIPVALDFESVTIGWVFKAEYFLPDNNTHQILDVFSDPFNPTPQPITGRKRRSAPPPVVGFDEAAQQRYEKYDVEAVEVESGPNEIKTDYGREYYNNYYDDADAEADDDAVVEETEEPVPVPDTESDSKYTLADIKKKQPSNMDTARFSLYHGIEKMAEKYVVGESANFGCISNTFSFEYHKYLKYKKNLKYYPKYLKYFFCNKYLKYIFKSVLTNSDD